MKTADNFDFTFLDDAHPEARCGFVIKVIPGFVGMRGAAEMIAARSAAGMPMVCARSPMRSGVRVIFTVVGRVQ